MIAPVSVCHQVSCTGLPKASWPQTTTSGLSGSPTLATWRRADRSCPRACSAPARISMRSAVGAVYQTVTRCSSRIVYQRSASNSSSSTMLVTPHVSGATIPYDVPVTQPGSAVHQNTSSPSPRSRTERAVAWCATTAWWTWTTPFGFPVVPLVKCSSDQSSGSVGGTGPGSGASASNACRSCTPPSVKRSAPGPAMSTWARSGSWSRMGATLRR